METRFWYAGREIPDLKGIEGMCVGPDKTGIENFLCGKKIPVTEYVLRAYIQDFIFRGETDTKGLIDRIVPPVIEMNPQEEKILDEYITEELTELRNIYSPFMDKLTGPIRQRAGELHTAVIELAAMLEKEDIDPSWMPGQAYIILSQIQNHAAGLMEELENDEGYFPGELEIIDESLDNLIETYEEIKESIGEALENYRRKRFTLIRKTSGKNEEWLIQLGIGGTEVWRRIIVPEYINLEELHSVIQTAFMWSNTQAYRFSCGEIMDTGLTIGETADRGTIEFLYEYGTMWTVKIIIISRNPVTGENPIRCVTGAGAPPPETIGGPLQYRRFISSLQNIEKTGDQDGAQESGQVFKPDVFDIESCNQSLNSVFKPEAAQPKRKGKNDI